MRILSIITAALVLAVSLAAQTVQDMHRMVVARKSVAPSVGFDKTGLVAWYDFDDTTDAHASFDLSAVGSPSFTAGYGVAAATGNYWQQSTVLATFMAATGDKTVVLRFRPYGGIGSGTNILAQAGVTALYVQHRTTGVRARCTIGSGPTSATGSALNTWVFVIAEYNATSGACNLYVNNGSAASSTAAQSLTGSGVALNLGANEATAAQDVEISVCAFFTRLLTSDERTYLYDAGSDITYADLD